MSAKKMGGSCMGIGFNKGFVLFWIQKIVCSLLIESIVTLEGEASGSLRVLPNF